MTKLEESDVIYRDGYTNVLVRKLNRTDVRKRAGSGRPYTVRLYQVEDHGRPYTPTDYHCAMRQSHALVKSRHSFADLQVETILAAGIEGARRVIFNTGEHRYTLTIAEATNEPSDEYGKLRIAYRLRCAGVTLFEGCDIRCSPFHAIDSAVTVRSVMDWLTLKPGDTDIAFFLVYTQRQLDFANYEAERLSFEVMCRFPTPDERREMREWKREQHKRAEGHTPLV